MQYFWKSNLSTTLILFLFYHVEGRYTVYTASLAGKWYSSYMHKCNKVYWLVLYTLK